MQGGVRDWVRRSGEAGEGTLRRASPTVLVSLLCASAVSPLVAAGAGITNPLAAAGVGVLSSVGGGVLGAVITEALDGLRGGDEGPSAQEVTDEVAGRIQLAVAVGDERAHVLLAEIATVLREIDAGGTALRAAIEAGGQRTSDEIATALGGLSGDFAELDFLVTDVADAAADIQRTLDEQGAMVRGIAEQNLRQSTEIRLAREVLAIIESRTRPGSAGGVGQVPRLADGCPYRGLLPFEASDEAVFYGRERLVAELAVRVTQGGLIVVTGASGAGKSSLLRAGLVPMLARGQQVAGSAGWPCRVLTPTADPVTELAVTLAVLGGGSTALIRERLTGSPEQAHLLVREAVEADAIRRAGGRPRPSGDDTRLVLVVDQFEQVFTLSPGLDGEAARAAFITALCAAATSADGPGGRAAAIVVIAVRGDFWDRCAAYPELVSQMQDGQFVVGPMTPAELRLAITGPAEAAGLSIDPALTDTIIGDLAASSEDAVGALPMLSQAMLLTWDSREGERLTHRAYELSGGVSRAVETSADAVYESLTPVGQVLARRILRSLTVAGRDGRFTRRPLSRADLYAACPEVSPPEVDAVLEAFAASRLVMLDDGAAQLAHDALLRAWPKLRGWLAEDQAAWALYGQLAEAAARWRDSGRDASFVYRGGQLAAVQEAAGRWAGDPGRFPVLTAAEQDFLSASGRAAARGARQRRVVAVALVVLLIAALAGGGIAGRAARSADAQSALAEKQRNAAVAAQFAQQSEALDGSDPVEAAQLAAAAWRLSPGLQARDSLLDAYAQPEQGDLRPKPGDPAAGPGQVMTVAFSPDGRLLATGSTSGMVRLWSVATRQFLGPAMKVEAAHVGPSVVSVAFSPDGKILATVSQGGEVQFWSVARHRQIGATIRPPGGQVTGFAFSPSGTMIATADDGDGTVRLWSVATRRQVGSPMAVPGRSAYQVAFSPDGRLLAAGNGVGVVQLWNVATHRRAGPSLGRPTSVPLALAFSPGGGLLAVAASGGVQMWSVVTHRRAGAEFGESDNIDSAAFTGDGTLATAGLYRRVQLWNVTTRQPVGPAMHANAAINALAFSPRRGYLATGDQDGAALLFSATGFRPAGTALEAGGQVYDAQFSPNGRLVATAGGNGQVRLWHAATHRQVGQPIEVVPREAEAGVNAVAFSPDGRLLVTGDGTGATRFWSVATRRQVAAPVKVVGLTGPLNQEGINTLAFNRQGSLLAIAGTNGAVLLWSVSRHRLVGRPIYADRTGSFPTVNAVAFSPDGRLLATSASNGIVGLWNVATHREVGTFRTGVEARALAFSPKGKLLAVGDDGQVTFISVASRRQVGPVLVQAGTVLGIAFSPDGNVLATAGSSGRTRLWDTATGRQVGPALSADGKLVYGVAFSPDGGSLVTASSDGAARLWGVAFPARLLRAVCAIAGDQSLSYQQWHALTPAPYRRTCP